MKRVMIQEEYCTFDTAKLLKEAGFLQDIKQTMFYNQQGRTWHMGDHHWTNGYAKPAQAVAMRWLREEKHISVEPLVTFDEQFSVNVWNFKTVEVIANDEVDSYPTYEAAAEAGIQAACKYMIGKSQSQL